MTKPTREWCNKDKTWIEETTKNKVRCPKCNRLLQVNQEYCAAGTCLFGQYLSAHKGKYK